MCKNKKIVLGGLRSGRTKAREKEMIENYGKLVVENIKKDREIERYKMVIKKLVEWYLPSGYEFKASMYCENEIYNHFIKKNNYYFVDKKTNEMYDLETKEEYETMKKVMKEVEK